MVWDALKKPSPTYKEKEAESSVANHVPTTLIQPTYDSESLDLEMLAEVIDSLHETYQTLHHNQQKEFHQSF